MRALTVPRGGLSGAGLVVLLALLPEAWTSCLNAQSTSYGHQTVFRYRCFEGSRPSYVSPITSEGNIAHERYPAGDVYAIDRGAGFDEFITTSFNGSSEYIRSDAPIDTMDSEGHDSFTIQAWFRANDVSGYRCLVSNTEGYAGFSLKVHNGTLRGLVRLENILTHVDLEMTGGTIIPDQWHQAAFRVKEESDHYDARLFLDGVQVGADSAPHYFGIRQSLEHPMVGAEPSWGQPDGQFFEGRIYAVSIQNYAVGIGNFLDEKQIRDASRYFGLISYHDYLSTTQGPDHRISATTATYPDLSMSGRRYGLPFLNDEYCPQGIDYRSGRLYIGYYWLATDGTTGARPSIIAEVDLDGRLQRVLQLRDGAGLPATTHVGGIAWFGNKLYVTAGDSVSRPRDIYRYDIASFGSYIFDPETFANPRGDMNPIHPDRVFTNLPVVPNQRLSWITVGYDTGNVPILWTGEFSSNSETRLFGFAILPNGDLDVSAPRYSYRMLETKVQGIKFGGKPGGHHMFSVTRSEGDQPSQIRNLLYARGVEAPLEASTWFTGPAGLQGLAYGPTWNSPAGPVDPALWTVSESGARHYQKRPSSPWYDLFPFVFTVDAPFLPSGIPRVSFQSTKPGTMYSLLLDGLIVGHEYFTIFTVNEPCPGIPGTGPYFGLWTQDPGVLWRQYLTPLGTPPWHFSAAAATLSWGSWSMPPGTVIEALCFDATNPQVLRISGVTRLAP